MKKNQNLNEMEYNVTQLGATEPPFSGEYWNFDKPGLYVDVVDGTPLFLSTEKFPSSCGWPAFAKPVDRAINYYRDRSHDMDRIEVRSSRADSHLGHVFNDGPASKGGLRYCINSAALRFIPYDKMDEEGYGLYKQELDREMKTDRH